MLVIREQLLKFGLIPVNHVNCEGYTSNPETCERLKSCAQQLIDQGTVQVGSLTKGEEEVATLEIPYPADEIQIPINTLMIQVPVPFPYESTEVIPWRYEPTMYMHGQESR